MTRRFAAPALLLMLAIAVGGCASADTPPPGRNTSPTGTPPPGPDTSPPVADEVLPLDFSRTGGLAGVDEQVRVGTDGTVTTSERSPFRLDADRLAALRQALSEPALRSPASRSATGAVCSDGYLYRVRTPSWARTADDCAPRQPAFDRVVALLLPLVRSDPAETPSSR
ncbi:hypothetical protein [Actinoplanes sp. M2I2]|uniref:hypothetical protein n=1 Tax=Actinoplanes sp. M2I2 TaxID=1734444 RepID=UPI0020220B2D|nr:hypothetical protein [Actinoplanes sp. M2I2]